MPRGKDNPEPDLLREVLESYTVPVLRGLAQLLDKSLPTRKAELVSLILKHLEDPQRLRQLWAELDDRQQAAVAEVVHSASGRFDGAAFRAKYGKDPNWGRINRWGSMEDPSPLGLFIYGTRVPRDLRGRLKAFVPAPRAAQIKTADEPPDTVSQSWYNYQKNEQETVEIPVIRAEMEHAAQHDLLAMLRLVDASKIRVSDKTKRVTAAGARAITEVLQGGDFYEPAENRDPWTTEPGAIKAFAWPLILQAAGLVELSGTKLQLTAAGRKALASPPHETIQRAWNRWLKTTILDEFNRVHTIKGQTGKGKRQMTAASSRREVIAKALAACPPHEWIAFDEFGRFMRASGYRFEVAHDLWHLYITDPNYGSLGYSGFGDWSIVQGRYLLAFLFEYAATMGLVDVAYIPPAGARDDYDELWGVDDLDCLSIYDGLLYLRLNGLGAWCLELTDEYVPSPLEVRRVFKVLPNRDVVAVEPLDPADRLFVEQFAVQTSDAVWHIEPVKLLEMLEQGQTVAQVQEFLTARSGGALPDNVAVFLQEMAERASQLVDRGPARLIEARDAALMQLIANDSRLKSLCLPAGDRYLVIPADSEATFRRALRELGYGLPLSQAKKR
jgi:hypothetical protein